MFVKAKNTTDEKKGKERKTSKSEENEKMRREKAMFAFSASFLYLLL